MRRTPKWIRGDLQNTLDNWVLGMQENDYLRMWIHDGLVRQMTDACMTIVDACRESQQFMRDNEKQP